MSGRIVTPFAPSNTSGAVTLPNPAELIAHDPGRDELYANGVIALGNGAETRALNLLRAQVLKRAIGRDFNLLGITSAEPEAGKSFVTANLAVALSRIDGQRVVLLDLDLKRPTVASRLAIEEGEGLEKWLAGESDDLAKVGRRFKESGLTIYPSFGQHGNSSDLLASARFGALADALRALPKTTIVLCDLPPTFVSDDAVTVLQRLDAYIHVIDEGVTPKRQVEEVRSMLEPAICLGAVLNRYAGRWNDSYGYAAAQKYVRYYDAKG